MHRDYLKKWMKSSYSSNRPRAKQLARQGKEKFSPQTAAMTFVFSSVFIYPSSTYDWSIYNLYTFFICTVELSWNQKSARTECTHYDHSFVVIKYHVLSIKVGKIFLNPRLQVISTTTVLCPSMAVTQHVLLLKYKNHVFSIILNLDD